MLFLPRSMEKENIGSEGMCNDHKRMGFFRPHSVPVVAIYLIFTFLFAYFRNNSNPEYNIFTSIFSVSIFMLIITTLVVPDGPLMRPHPVFWRLIFALTILYIMILVSVLFLNIKTVKSIMFWFFPHLESVTDVFQTPYDMDCNVYTWKNIFSKTDVYTFGHFFGWIAKALIVRHYGFCWLLSITWEVTELAFTHLLPFAECWWDTIVLDVLLTNGLGIFVGMLILKLFNLETYEWECFKEEQMSNADSRQNLIKFSAEARNAVKSFDHLNIYVRVLAISLINLFWQITELNTFFQMQIFDVPASHPLAVGRLVLIALIDAPAFRDYLTYINQDQFTKLSPWTWLLCVLVFMETAVSIKYEPKILANLRIWNVILWLIILLFFGIICIALCIYWSNMKDKKIEPDTCIDKV